ncbi:MAG: YitT family protein [Culicoidibacterales bacterium]
MITNYQTRRFYQFVAVILGTMVYGIGVTTFLKPNGIMPGGLAGISQILQVSTGVQAGLTLFILNVPLLIFGWFYVSQRFTALSTIALVITMTTFDYLRLQNPIHDYYLSIIFGSLLAGFGIGIALRFGGSLGGTDIVSNYLSIRRGKSTAQYNLMINALVIVASGIVQNSFEKALLTLVSMFIVAEVVNAVHTRHEKMLLMVITSEDAEVVEYVQKKVRRGITVVDGMGAYTKKEKKILFMTVSSYQLYMTQSLIREVDQCAFINVLPVKKVIGNFNAGVSY